MHRFFLSPEKLAREPLMLDGDEAHHAANVLRVRVGERLNVLDGAGTEAVCNVTEVTKRRVGLEVAEKKFSPRPRGQITLCQALVKGKAFDFILQKATELGATRIVPVQCERSVVQADAAHDAADKLAKWRATMIEAAKQCGIRWLPQIEEPITPAEFLARGEKFDFAMVGSLGPQRVHPRECFREFRRAHSRGAESVCVWIGPEGDFSPRELAMLREAGVRGVTLGANVLRADTAALAAVAVCSYEMSAEDGESSKLKAQSSREGPEGKDQSGRG